MQDFVNFVHTSSVVHAIIINVKTPQYIIWFLLHPIVKIPSPKKAATLCPVFFTLCTKWSFEMREYSAYEMNRKMQYMMQMRPVLKKRGLFSDGTADYRIPAEPEAGETVIIRFRAAINNIDIVWLWSGEHRYTMRKTET